MPQPFLHGGEFQAGLLLAPPGFLQAAVKGRGPLPGLFQLRGQMDFPFFEFPDFAFRAEFFLGEFPRDGDLLFQGLVQSAQAAVQSCLAALGRGQIPIDFIDGGLGHTQGFPDPGKVELDTFGPDFVFPAQRRQVVAPGFNIGCFGPQFLQVSQLGQ